jgi:hypothetical protein
VDWRTNGADWELSNSFEDIDMNSASFNSCISACNDCAVACDRCAAACLTESDVAKMARAQTFAKPAPTNARSTRWGIARTAPRPAAAAPKNAAA